MPRPTRLQKLHAAIREQTYLTHEELWRLIFAAQCPSRDSNGPFDYSAPRCMLVHGHTGKHHYEKRRDDAVRGIFKERYKRT